MDGDFSSHRKPIQKEVFVRVKICFLMLSVMMGVSLGSTFDISAYGAVVLGCTHFPLFAHHFEKIFSSEVRLIDGSSGTVSHLEKLILAQKVEPCFNASLTFYRSSKKLESSQEIEPFTKILKQLKAI